MKQFLYLIWTICSLHSQAQTYSPDTFNLHELKKILGSSVIVGLGEVGHGFETINKTKSALLQFLESELKFEAIAFEGSFTESVVSFMKGGDLDSRAKSFLYPFWNTPSVKTSLKSFFDKEKGLKPLIIGFDIQEDCRFNKLSQLLIEKQLVFENKGKLDECDSVLSYYIGEHFSRKGTLSKQEYLLLIQNYELIEIEIRARRLDLFQSKLLERSIENRKWLCRYLTLSTAKDKMYYRDSLMADNVKWIQKEIYPTNKFILWAANTHIAKKAGNRNTVWMGEWLSSFFRDNYFAISFQKGTAGKPFISSNTSYNYPTTSNEKFDLVIYMDKLKKIRAQEWMTSCD